MENHRPKYNLPDRIITRTVPGMSRILVDGVRFCQTVLSFTKMDFYRMRHKELRKSDLKSCHNTTRAGFLQCLQFQFKPDTVYE